MAAFVEEAVLRLTDQTSRPANTINAALKKLLGTARQMRNMPVRVSVSAPGLKQVVRDLSKLKSQGGAIKLTANIGQSRRQIQALARDIEKLTGGKRQLPQLTIRVNSNQVATAIARLGQLRAMAAQGAPAVRVNAGIGGGGRGGPPRGTIAAVANSPNFGSFAANLAITAAALMAVRTAARTLEGAFVSLANNAAKRDRAGLQSSVQASEAQRRVFREMGGENAPKGAGAIQFTASERKAFWAGILGDVQGNETQRATAASNLTAQIEKDVLPRLYAAQEGKSRDEVLTGLRQIVKGLNLASSELVDSSGKLTASGQRAFDGIQLAIAANPELDPGLIRTTLANLKTSALSLNARELASVLISAGDRGVRAANEAFRAQVSATGTVDNKALNNALASLGLLRDVERNKKGNVIAGSGRPVDQELLQEAPREWIVKNFKPAVERALRSQNREITDANLISEGNRMLPGMSSAGRQFFTDAMTGVDQMKAALDQAQVALSQSVPQAIRDSWVAQAEGVGVAWKNAVGTLGDSAAKFVGAAEILSGLAGVLRGDFGPGAQAAAAGGGAAVVGGTALLGARIAFGPLFSAGPALNGSAVALNGAALALSRAAALQGARGSVPGIPGPLGTPGAASRNPAGPSLRSGISQSLLTAGGLLGGFALAVEGATDAVRYFGMSAEERTKAQEAAFKAASDRNDALNEAIKNAAPKPVVDAARSAQDAFEPVREAIRKVAPSVANMLFSPKEAPTGAPALAAARAAERGTPMPEVAARNAQQVAARQATEDAAEAQALRSEIAKLNAQIAQQRAAEKIPGTAEAATHGARNQVAQLSMQLAEIEARAATQDRKSPLAGTGFTIDTDKIAQRPAGNDASNFLTAVQSIADRLPPASLTRTATPGAGLLGPEVTSTLARNAQQTSQVAEATTRMADQANKSPLAGTGFAIDTEKLVQRREGNEASNYLTAPKSLAEQSPTAALTKTSAPNASLLSPDLTASLGQSAQTFQATFQTGAATIQQAGATTGSELGSSALSTMSGGAAGIGAAIGAAAAAAISAAAANISVNVKAAGAGPNVGSSASVE